MHVRLTFVKVHHDKVKALVSIYNAAIVPAVKKAKGNVDLFMLEPVHPGEDFISVTRWHSKADADLYESSGLYKTLMGKVVHTFSAPPVLKDYETN